MSGDKQRPEWTDRRRWNNGLLVFTACVVAYSVVRYPLAPDNSLISRTLESLITACVFVVTGYTAGRLVEKHRALTGDNNGAPRD